MWFFYYNFKNMLTFSGSNRKEKKKEIDKQLEKECLASAPKLVACAQTKLNSG